MTEPYAGADLDTSARALAAAMEAEHQIYASMLDVCRREERAIVGGDVEALTALSDEKELLIEHLNALETERMTALLAIGAAADDLDAATATLSEIAAVLPAALAASLTETGIVVGVRARAVEEANRRNAALLRNSRELVDRWVQYLRALLGGSLYTAGGSSRGVSGGRALDRSA